MPVNKKKLALIPLLLLIISLPFTVEKMTDSQMKAPTVYEYQLITQEKGESLDEAFKEAGLSADNIAVLNELPIYRTEEVDRDFRLIFQIEAGKRSVKEVKLTYDNRMANFVLNEEEGERYFVSQASQIPERLIRNSKEANDELFFTDASDASNGLADNLDPGSLIDSQEDAAAVVIPPEALLMEKQALTGAQASKAQSIAAGQRSQTTTSPTTVEETINPFIGSTDDASDGTTADLHADDATADKADKAGSASTVAREFADAGLTVAPIIVDAVFVGEEPKDKPSTAAKSPVPAVASPPKESVATVVETKKEIDLLGKNENIFALRVTQYKRQRLENALAPLKLSKTQSEIVATGDFIKSALSSRQLTLYFTGSKKHKLLRGMTVKRGSHRVDYVVSSFGDKYYLSNLKSVDNATRQLAQQRFERVPTQTLTGSAQTTIGNASVASKKTSKASKAQSGKQTQRGSVVDSGRFRVLRIRQKKGQSLSSALRAFSLSGAQKRLIAAMPVSKRAKSTRYINILFEKRGRSKYLRAVRVTRGKRASEYVLTQYKGKWYWADRQGKIRIGGTIRQTGGGGFLRYPLNFSRISSPFNPRRRHPVTRRIRPHRGTDFKAPHGAPVWAPANGVVTFAGRQRGYGITLIIDHGNGYKTKYAHLSRIMKNARRGKRVRKRQIVARVGNTGVSTGAHLHYEVLVNGRARNPMTVRLPGGGGGGRRTASAAKTKQLASARRDANKYLSPLRRMAR